LKPEQSEYEVESIREESSFEIEREIDENNWNMMEEKYAVELSNKEKELIWKEVDKEYELKTKLK